MSDLDPTLPTYRAVAAVIERRIRSGELAPGDRVPSVTALVQEYGIARNTALRVVGVLRDRGLITISRGWGSFVTDRDNWSDPE